MKKAAQTKIGAISIAESLSFVLTNKDLTIVDLGCVFFGSFFKSFTYGAGLSGQVVIDKQTMLPITLEKGKPESNTCSPIIWERVINYNDKEPQEGYFMLRYSEKNRVDVYTPDGKLVRFQGLPGYESDVYCGKYAIAFRCSDTYMFFSPITGESIDIDSMVVKYFGNDLERGIKPKAENGDLTITVSEGCNVDYKVVGKFRVSESLELEKI